jgi:acyl carrier protein
MTLASIWKHLLRLDKVGINDNFFEIGGHSLLAMRLIAAISKQMNVDLSIRILFQFKTIYELGRYIEIQTQSAPSAVDSSEFELIDI